MSSRSNNPKIVCVCVHPSKHGGNLRSTQRSAEGDGQRLQGLIDGNKRWLEMRRKDTSVYPYVTHTHPRTHVIVVSKLCKQDLLCVSRLNELELNSVCFAFHEFSFTVSIYFSAPSDSLFFCIGIYLMPHFEFF